MSQVLPIHNLNRVKLSQAIPLDTPFSVFLFPTTCCNFKCIYCAHSLDDAEMKRRYDFTAENMSMETYQTAIEQLKQFPHKLKLLSLTGQGEPMLNRQLPEMIHKAKEAQIAERIEIISNGSLLTHEYADRLISAGLDGLRISLQGLNGEKYAETCGYEVNFEQFLERIQYFFQHKKQCDLFVKIMDTALAPGEDELFYRTFDGISDRMYIERCRPVYDGVAFTAQMDSRRVDRYGNEHPPREVCPLCFFMLSIFPNGDVEPCDAIYRPVILGNIHTETLREMFTGQKLRRFQFMQLNGRRWEHPKCSVCCAPDDVSHPLDCLDDSAGEIIRKLEKGRTEDETGE